MDIMNTRDQIKSVIQDLTSPTGGEHSLADLKVLVQSARSDELTALLEELNLEPLFAILSDSFIRSQPPVETQEVIDIFSALLNNISPNFIASRFQRDMVIGLQAHHEAINAIWLKALTRVLDSEVAAMNLNNSESVDEILLNVIELLGRESTAIANLCHIILVLFARNSSMLQHFLSAETSSKFSNVKKTNDVNKLRVLSLMVEIGTVSDATLNLLDQAGYLSDIRGDDLSDDPLFALNIVQIMTTLASCQHGVEFLHKNNCLKNIASEITSEDLILADILLPGYYALFACAGSKNPKLIGTHYRPVIERLIDVFSPDGIGSLLGSSIDVIGVLGKTVPGKNLLNSFSTFAVVLKKIGHIIATNGGDLKTRAITTLGWLLAVDEADPNGEAAILTEEWYEKLSPSRKEFTKTLVAVCRQPFLETRLAAMNVVRVMCTHMWGQKELVSIPKFLDYLLERATEFDKAGKEAKFAIVRELVTSPFASVSINAEARLRIRKFYKEGAFFVDTEPTVAVEGES